jgi:hypothetical protein
MSQPDLHEEQKKRVFLDVATSEVVEDNKKVIGEKDVTIIKYIDLLASERKTNEELRTQVNTREGRKKLSEKQVSTQKARISKGSAVGIRDSTTEDRA